MPKTKTGTFHLVSSIMREHGFNPESGKTVFGLEKSVREMLSIAYIKGWTDGRGKKPLKK